MDIFGLNIERHKRKQRDAELIEQLEEAESTNETLVAELVEAQADYRMAQRRLEDASYTNLGGTASQYSSDVNSNTRHNAVRRGIDYWVKDPIIGRTVDMLTDYVMGGGFRLPQTSSPKLAEVLSRFWGDPENQLVLTSIVAQRQKFTELQLMGNVFLVAFVNEATGHVKLSDLPPAEITDIITAVDNRKKHLFYRRDFRGQSYDYKSGSYTAGDSKTLYYQTALFSLPDGEPQPDKSQLGEGRVIHLSVNRLSDSKFGNPVTMRIVEWVRAYNEYMKGRMSLMQALASVAFHKKIKGNPSDVRKIADSYLQQNPAAYGTRDGAAPPPQYAATYTSNDAISLEQVKTDTGGASAMQDGRMLKGQVGMGTGWPLHYLGDVGGANLATATAMEVPVRKMVEAMQSYLEDIMRSVIDYVIVQAILRGTLKPTKSGRFSAERIAKIRNNELSEAMLGYDSDDREEYDYRLSLPEANPRQISEQVNATINLLRAIDPYKQNVDASRWAMHACLTILGDENPQATINKVLPEGYEYPVEDEQPSSGGLSSSGDSDKLLKDTRKPSSSAALGQKGLKRARSQEEIASTNRETEMFNAINYLMDIVESKVDALEGDDSGAEAGQ